MVKFLKLVGVGVVIIVVAYGVFAVTYHTSERFRARVVYGSDLDHADIGGWTALHRAAAGGDVAMLEYLLAQGVDAEATTGRGETAWHIATQHGRTEAAELLAAQGVPTSEIEFPEFAGPYLGQALPGAEPELFAPGIVSGHYPAHSPCVLSPNLSTMYWTVGRPPHGAMEMMQMGPPDFTWTRPELTDMMGEPSFSVDGRRLFFISRQPLRAGEPGGSENIWVKERTADGWSEPTPLGDAVNSKSPHFHHSVDSLGNLYFSDYNTLYYSEYRNGEYQQAVNLAAHLQNDSLRGNSPSVSPAGDFILFAGKRGLRGKELCVTFKKADGTWSDKISLGDVVNAGRLNDSPRLTPAGNFIFFVSAGNGRPWGIYWLSAEILDDLKREHVGMEPPPSAVEARRGSTPRIDGVFAKGEWEDATTLELSATKKILLKHDGENLYVAIETPGADLFFNLDNRVHQLHASAALGSREYAPVEGGSWSFVSKSPIVLRGLQRQPADEIDAAIAQNLEENGWAASLLPMGNPYQTEFAISFEWLGVANRGAEPGPLRLPRMATIHASGPPHMRPTWPTGVTIDTAALMFRGEPERLEFDVENWGGISVSF
jgi:hypothetical protein